MHHYIVQNPTLTTEVLQELAKKSDDDIRWQIANIRRINEETFLLLANDANPEIRYRVVLNTKVPQKILQILSQDVYVDETLNDETIAEIALRKLKEYEGKNNIKGHP